MHFTYTPDMLAETTSATGDPTPGRPAGLRQAHPVPAVPRALVVLDFDGFLVNSYAVLHSTFEIFGLDIGDETRFRHRRKFLKYLGGGREILGNLVSYALPRKRRLRQTLTEQFLAHGRVYLAFTPLVNAMIASPRVHVGIVSRNFTLNPGTTMRAVLRHSGVREQDLDFVIPIPVGAEKRDVLDAMQSPRYDLALFGADEIGDYRAAKDAGYDAVMAGYGFDAAKRLIDKGQVPPDRVFDTPERVVGHLRARLAGVLG